MQTLSGANTYTGNTSVGSGTLILSGANTGSAASVSTGGILRVDYNGTATGNILDAGKALTIAGGAFQVFGNSAADRTQTFASLSVGGGVGSLSVTNNGAISTGLNFTSGTISRTGGGAVNFVPSAPGTGIRLGTGANPFLGSYALYGGTNYAATDSNGFVIAAAAGSGTTGINDFTSAGAYYSYSSPGATDTLTASRTADAANFSTAGPQVIDLGGDATSNSLGLNGLINNGGTLTIERNGTSTGTVVAGTAANGGLVIGGSSAVIISAPVVDFAGGASAFTSANLGMVTLSGANTYTGATNNGSGTLVVGGAGQLGGGTYAGAIANDGTFNYASSGAQTLSGIIAGKGGLIASGAGILTLTGANSYTGSTSVGSGGYLVVNGNTQRGTSQVNVAAGGTYEIRGTNLFVSNHGTPLADSRVITVDGGTLLMSSSTDTRFGNVTLSNGAVWTSNRTLVAFDALLGNTTAGAATVKVTGTGAATMNGTGGIHLQGVQNFDVDNTTGDPAADLNVTMILGAQGNIGGAAGGINKLGVGTMVLANNNTYTGITMVTGGTLAIGSGGSIANSSQISVGATAILDVTAASGFTVGAAQILSGFGTVQGSTLIDGTLAPGSSPGTLTFANDLGFGSTATLSIELNPADMTPGGGVNDLFTVGGNLVLDGTVNITGTSSFNGVTSGTWTFGTYAGTLTDNVLNLGSVPALDSGYNWSLDTSNPGLLNLMIVPEPGSALLAALSSAALLLRRRKSA